MLRARCVGALPDMLRVKTPSTVMMFKFVDVKQHAGLQRYDRGALAHLWIISKHVMCGILIIT